MRNLIQAGSYARIVKRCPDIDSEDVVVGDKVLIITAEDDRVYDLPYEVKFGNDCTEWLAEDQLEPALISDREKREAIYRLAVLTWGEKAQFEMAQEEATELALAVRGVIRGREGADHHLAEEIADMEIMIEQMKMMKPELVKSVGYIKRAKLRRLKNRLSEGAFNG